MLLISESFGIFVFTILSSFLLLPSIAYRLYYLIDLTSPNIWLVLLNVILCALGSLFQEAMVRRIKKIFGYLSIGFFAPAIPLTLYNLTFSDPAPYFTLCTFGCFSVENCTTTDQTWGNYTSLSYVFALAFLLTGEVLSIRFNLIFIKFTTFDVRSMVEEVNQKYKNRGKKGEDGEDDDEDDKDASREEADETKFPAVKTKIDNKEREFEIHSDHEKEMEDKKDLGFVRVRKESEGFQTYFSNVAKTFKPIDYRK